MKMLKVLLIVAAAAVVLALAGFAVTGAIMFDLMSATATGSETLSPGGVAAGHALVVYNPGVSGAARNVASTIAEDLKAKGYAVTLAGVKSPAAADTAGYDVIVAGGPIYAGKASGSIAAYMRALTPPAGAKVGAFGTGSSKDNPDDSAGLRRELTALPDGSPLEIRATVKVLNTDDAGDKCAGFVDGLLG